jgi:hypothetical protein
MHRRVRRTRVQFSKAWRGSPSSRSAVDDRQIESADALGVGQDIHLHDLVAGNREGDHGERSPVRPRPHGRRGTCRRSLRHRPAARCWESSTATSRAKSPSRAARELARRNGRPIHDRTDLVERHAEHVVEHEREPLRRLEGLEHDEQRESDRIGEHRVDSGLPSILVTTGSGTCTSKGSSRRDVRVRSMSRHTRATTAVSHARRFSTPLTSARLSRSQPSCTACSASLTDQHPIRYQSQNAPGAPRIARRAAQEWASVTFLGRGPSW